MKSLTLVAMLSIFLTGCFDKNEEIHNVAWFKLNEVERNTTLEKCSNNPGELKEHPNCINARQAEKELIVGSLPTLKFEG
ncbi:MULTISPECIES: EexN family lipoprotein [Vibrio]|uniref:EexN family lipoprotein n=1 Tax=Vibrio TaxID=662 RepID=UPI001BD5AEF9|nr:MULTISPECIES: EexN family lipoprotein [Vibrio]MBT0110607.1 EexN family lipoprotein [Vibrio alginolyticus]MDW2193980.1 EexN family lipoprotein [Vibrio sp. 1641]MDW2328404.1 EexN family lipoprotein [Vibrio sp. 1401]